MKLANQFADEYTEALENGKSTDVIYKNWEDAYSKAVNEYGVVAGEDIGDGIILKQFERKNDTEKDVEYVGDGEQSEFTSFVSGVVETIENTINTIKEISRRISDKRL